MTPIDAGDPHEARLGPNEPTPIVVGIPASWLGNAGKLAQPSGETLAELRATGGTAEACASAGAFSGSRPQLLGHRTVHPSFAIRVLMSAISLT